MLESLIPQRMGAELHQFKSSDDLVREVAARWTRETASGDSTHSITVALSGGRIARGFFCALAAEITARPLSTAWPHFFWADERCVPPDHAESNFRLAQDYLLAPLRAPADRVHRIRGELSPEDGASQAAETLNEIAAHNEAGMPVLDYVFLGMGEDGHVASVFPDALPEVLVGSSPYVAVTAAKLPSLRITLTMKVLQSAKAVWVLASGAGKEQAFERIPSAWGQHAPRPIDRATDDDAGVHGHPLNREGARV